MSFRMHTHTLALFTVSLTPKFCTFAPSFPSSSFLPRFCVAFIVQTRTTASGLVYSTCTMLVALLSSNVFHVFPPPVYLPSSSHSALSPLFSKTPLSAPARAAEAAAAAETLSQSLWQSVIQLYFHLVGERKCCWLLPRGGAKRRESVRKGADPGGE